MSNWLRSEHVPDGSVTKFEPIPTPALGYAIGTVLGDGSTSIGSDHNHMIKLRVKDKDFAEAFAVAVGQVLGEDTPPQVKLNPKDEELARPGAESSSLAVPSTAD